MFVTGSNQSLPITGCFSDYKLSNVYKIANLTASATETLETLLQKISTIINLPTHLILILDSSSSAFSYFSSNTKRAEGDFTADVSFVVYAETEEDVVLRDTQITESLGNQTIWPSAKVSACGASSATCRSSTETVGPAPISPPSSDNSQTTAANNRDASALFSFATIVVVIAASLIAAL